MNHVALIMQILQASQNVLREAQDKFETKSQVAGFLSKTGNVVAKDVGDETNMSASETLECKFAHEMNYVLKTGMMGCCIWDLSKDVTLSEPSCFDFPRCV